MAKFPYSYGSLEITKYPKAQYLNVTLPGESEPVSCIVLPFSSNWMRLYADKNGKVHAEVSVNIDDASGLNNWAREQAQQQNKNHTDFHGQIHLTPGSDARKAWQKKLEEKYDGMMPDEMEKELQKLRLDKASIAQSDYYRQHPDRIPTREQLVQRLAQNEMQRLTAAGRIYSPDLNEAPAPVPTASASGAAVPSLENVPGYNAASAASAPVQIEEDELPF